jgi:hypothetical protein
MTDPTRIACGDGIPMDPVSKSMIQKNPAPHLMRGGKLRSAETLGRQKPTNLKLAQLSNSATQQKVASISSG